MADLINRDDVLEDINRYCKHFNTELPSLITLINEIPTAEPKVVGDIVSRGDTRRVVTVTEPSDLISRANAIRWVKTECNPYGKPTLDYDSGLKFIEHLKKMPSRLPSAETEWIPFTRRPMTEEEQKDYPNCTFMFDCVLPDDGDEILVSNGRFVWMDTFCTDIDGCYLDGGDDIDEDMAWMPLPKPYKAESEDEE